MNSSFADQETLTHRTIPGTTVLLGLGSCSYGELWTGEELNKLKPIGRAFAQDVPSTELELQNDGYTVKHNDVQWLATAGQRYIKQVACGSLHVIFLEFNGRCWALGDNDDGQLGLGHRSKVKYPTLIRGDIKNVQIESIDVGGWFSAFLSVTGQVFTCGNIGRLFWDEATQSTVKAERSNLQTTQYIPRAVLMDPEHTHQVSKMGCGNRFLLMQDLYTMNLYKVGDSRYRTARAGNNTVDPYPSLLHYIHPDSLLRIPIDFQCKKIDAGENFSVLLDYQGNLFAATQEDYERQEYFHSQNIHVIDVCCSWAQYIVLDVRGFAHVASTAHAEKVITLHSLGFVNQIGSGNVNMYVRSDKRVYKIHERPTQDVVAPALLEFETEIDREEKAFIKLTGSYFTTMLHQAVVKRSTLMFNINSLRLKQLLCDVSVICNNYEQT